MAETSAPLTAQEKLFLDLALGDGYINVRPRLNKGKYPYISRNLVLAHSPAQLAYLEWKRELLERTLDRKILISHHTNLGPGKKYENYSLQVTAAKELIRPFDLLYVNKTKTFSEKLFQHLDLRSLLIFFLDDGHVRRNLNNKGETSSLTIELSTYCSELEARLFSEWLQRLLEVKFQPIHDKRCAQGSDFFLRANTEASVKFCSIISEHVPKAMDYKLDYFRKYQLGLREGEVGNCKVCGKPIFDRRRKGQCQKCYYAERTTDEDRRQKAIRQAEANKQYLAPVEGLLSPFLVEFSRHYVRISVGSNIFIVKSNLTERLARVECPRPTTELLELLNALEMNYTTRWSKGRTYQIVVLKRLSVDLLQIVLNGSNPDVSADAGADKSLN